jgi:hypothetical protein
VAGLMFGLHSSTNLGPTLRSGKEHPHPHLNILEHLAFIRKLWVYQRASHAYALLLTYLSENLSPQTATS